MYLFNNKLFKFQLAATSLETSSLRAKQSKFSTCPKCLDTACFSTRTVSQPEMASKPMTLREKQLSPTRPTLKSSKFLSLLVMTFSIFFLKKNVAPQSIICGR